jgi:hypothetical protein
LMAFISVVWWGSIWKRLTLLMPFISMVWWGSHMEETYSIDALY